MNCLVIGHGEPIDQEYLKHLVEAEYNVTYSEFPDAEQEFKKADVVINGSCLDLNNYMNLLNRFGYSNLTAISFLERKSRKFAIASTDNNENFVESLRSVYEGFKGKQPDIYSDEYHTLYDVEFRPLEFIISERSCEIHGIKKPSENKLAYFYSPTEHDKILKLFLLNNWISRSYIMGTDKHIIYNANIQNPKSIVYCIKELERIKNEQN